MELVHPDLTYGDTWEELDKPLVILSELESFPATGMKYTSIARPGTHRSAYKRTRQLFRDGILPALHAAFGIKPEMFPVCYRWWHKFIYECLRFRMVNDDYHYN
jgi:hypothetical protein